MATDLTLLLERCLKHEPAAQRELYERYAYKMMGVCLRYAKSVEEAEDLLQDGFVKVFTRLKDFRSNGSFEGWVRRVMVTTAIDQFNKQKIYNQQFSLDDAPDLPAPESDALDRMEADQVLELINQLPDGARMVLVLYTIEGYTHAEIGEMLKIKESTSKAQLSKARKMLVTLLQDQQNYVRP